MAATMRGPLATVDNYLHGYDRRGRGEEWAHELITFALGEEQYGLELLRVREIVTQRPITEVPRTPRFLLGVFSLRGAIVPVVDLRRRLGLPDAEATRQTRILICDRAGEPMGLRVDRVAQVERLGAGELEHRPAALSGRDSDFIAGIGRPGGRGMIILLALDAVLAFTLGRRAAAAGKEASR